MFQELLSAEFDRAQRSRGLSESAIYRLTPQQLALLEQHYNRMTRWNQRLNLTRISALEEAVQLHYCESLFLGTLLPPGPLTIADVGSGAGFPGIPVAILRPECKITLIESHQRKAVFLREASRELKNVSVLPERAQDLRQSFDWTISRAVSPQEVVGLELSKNLALLIGHEDSLQLGETWETYPLPWGKARVAALQGL